ncbi:MAG: formylglycine-generating enzyme family protein [Phycisphaerales bacterium]|nr:formylglycine-generating enzyme family protein [Phycisphaerales bacterium]
MFGFVPFEESEHVQNQVETLAAIAVCAGLSVSVASASLTIPTITIGNIGNAPDVNDLGSVEYVCNIGVTEVTNAQYATFLNAVAATDANNLYNSNMAGINGGITRSGSAGAFTYATITGRDNNPVNFVSFWDTTRFANWLHNGQPTGTQSNSTTEDGAYTLTPAGISASSITRNANWRWAVTSDNEWYNAAYHQPASQGGDSDNYWLYPTSSNAISTSQANYGNVIGTVTPVGAYAPNFYGVFDLAGNVEEWGDTISFTNAHAFWGGRFTSTETFLRAGIPFVGGTTSESAGRGFRVVHIPSPSSLGLAAFGGLIAARRRR